MFARCECLGVLRWWLWVNVSVRLRVRWKPVVRVGLVSKNGAQASKLLPLPDCAVVDLPREDNRHFRRSKTLRSLPW